MADDYYRKYMESKHEIDLNAWCAVLYRPARSGIESGDIREEFNPHVCLKRAGKFRKLSFEERFVILSWFSACDHYFKSGEIEIDGRLISLAPLFKQASDSGEEDNSEGLGLTGILLGIDENGVFGTVEEVKRTNLYSVLLRLYLWYLDNKRLEKMYANGKSK